MKDVTMELFLLYSQEENLQAIKKKKKKDLRPKSMVGAKRHQDTIKLYHHSR